MRHLISLKKQSAEDILDIVKMAQEIKAERKAGKLTNYLPNKTLLMLFQKTSTRTRLSFEAAMTELGGHAIFIDSRITQFSLADFSDEIRAMMRFGDLLMFRAKKVSDVEQAASYNQIPVIDGCSEKYHPAQALGDILTMAEYSRGIENIKKIAWLGIENNVLNTLMLACTKLGIKVVIAAPEIDEDSVDEELKEQAEKTGLVSRTLNPKEALKEADFVHTDTWMNMEFFQDGEIKPEYKDEHERRKNKLLPYQLNARLIDNYAPQAKIMHCMPCHPGFEISRDAIGHPNSIIFNQAENRLHIQKAMIMWLLEKKI